jgi:hypothetical protein
MNEPKVNKLAFHCDICEHSAVCDILEAEMDEREPHHANRSRPFKINCKLGIPPEWVEEDEMPSNVDEDCKTACLGEFLNEIAVDLKHIRMSLEQANESLNAIIQTIDK